MNHDNRPVPEDANLSPELAGPIPASDNSPDADTRGSDGRDVVIIGGGPAGLTAGYQLIKYGFQPTILEKLDKVGGISRTESYKGFYFDMGGHRFFTKAKEVEEFWHEVLTDDFLRRPRLSRIYYGRKFFAYPLKPFNALAGLGLWESALVILSYLKSQVFKYRQEDTYEQWVTNRFGQRLFQLFFKSYTEKVWGIPCSELKSEWAAQRIKDLSVKTAILSMFFKPKKTIKTLIEQFDYPRLGPGMLWNKVKTLTEDGGGRVLLNTDVVEVRRTGSHIDSVVVCREGELEEIKGASFISSMAVNEFVQKLNPPAPEDVLSSARKIKHREFLTVCLIVNTPALFPDNWIYIHDPSVEVGRIQNFKNWSPDMVPDLSKTSLGMEYWCNEGDEFWSKPDSELVEQAKREIEKVGLAKYEDVEDGCVFRISKAYPIYDSDYREDLPKLKEYVEGLENFQTVGRNGLHRYNNQDHAMLTGMLAARNVAFREANDLWSVNEDKEYHEEIRTIEAAVNRGFAKLDRLAFGFALGTVSGLALFLATLILAIKGGNAVGPNLQLLSEYFPGYVVSLGGSVLGLAYGFLTGFVGGWGFALIRNTFMFLAVALLRRGAELQVLRRVLEYI